MLVIMTNLIWRVCEPHRSLETAIATAVPAASWMRSAPPGPELCSDVETTPTPEDI